MRWLLPDAGGIFDREVGRAVVYLGDAETPPSYDEQSGRVTGVVEQTSVVEGSWTGVELTPGRYGIWVTNGGDVVVTGCQPGSVTDPSPADPDQPRVAGGATPLATVRPVR